MGGICSSLKTQGHSELNLLGMFFRRSEFHTQKARGTRVSKYGCLFFNNLL